jgi:hypothetical protein
MCRMNCLDCVDDTNIMQQGIGMHFARQMLEDFNVIPDRSLLSILEKLWKESGNAISSYYIGTHSLSSTQWMSALKSEPISFTYISLCRMYLSYQDVNRQEQIDFFMADWIPRSKSGLMVQRHVMHLEYKQQWWISGLVFLSKYFAPKKIKNIVQFVSAMNWLMIFVIYRKVLRVKSELLSQRSASSINLSDIKRLSSPRNFFGPRFRRIIQNK